MPKGEYVLDPWRWFVLLIFGVTTFNQCLAWFSFSTIDSDSMAAYFGPAMDKDCLDLILNWGPIFGVVAFPLQVWLAEQNNGLYKSIWVGILLVLTY